MPENIDQSFLLTTGAEATEAAIRIAKRFTGKHEILSFYGGFHGRTYGPMSVAGSMKTKREFARCKDKAAKIIATADQLFATTR